MDNFLPVVTADNVAQDDFVGANKSSPSAVVVESKTLSLAEYNTCSHGQDQTQQQAVPLVPDDL